MSLISSIIKITLFSIICLFIFFIYMLTKVCKNSNLKYKLSYNFHSKLTDYIIFFLMKIFILHHRWLLNFLKVCHWNCRGVYSKLTELKLLLSQPGKERDVLGISSSWLTEISMPGYSFIRKDRYSSKRGGGILIFIKDSLSVIRREELEYVQDEYVWFELKNGHASPLLLCFAYWPPNADLSWFILFEEKVTEALAIDKYTIIMGTLILIFES